MDSMTKNFMEFVCNTINRKEELHIEVFLKGNKSSDAQSICNYLFYPMDIEIDDKEQDIIIYEGVTGWKTNESCLKIYDIQKIEAYHDNEHISAFNRGYTGFIIETPILSFLLWSHIIM